ncbi:MAG: methylthioribulose 1-phosphate dehydratase [Myxococcota bacterium]|nr:methylthioribulose 1-phosphate dehydratase [Myxococcota bacterium]
MSHLALRKRLCNIAKQFYDKGWMLGTAGNLSVRTADNTIWMTASGQNKGELTPQELLLLTPDGKVLWSANEHLKPSAETSIHLSIYRQFPNVRACLHVHMLESNWLCRKHPESQIELASLEMLKGLGAHPKPRIEVVPNHRHVPDIPEELERRYRSAPPQVPGFLIRDHGITAWGADLSQARNYIELFSYVFSFMCREY